MKTISKTMTSMLSAAAVTMLAGIPAWAGCGDTQNLWGPFEFQTPQAASAPLSAQVRNAVQVSEPDSRGTTPASIVGLWNIQFVSLGNVSHTPSIPDGAIIDFGYSQWHSDGNEFLNSGGHMPSTQNYCLGVWEQTANGTYVLNHFALSYDAVTGALTGKVNIREQITLSPGGTLYTGTFTIDVFDPKGNHVDHLAGTITATRITVDTATP